MAISIVRAGEQKRGIASCLAMTKSSCHRGRSVAISVVRAGEQKSEIASQARNDRLEAVGRLAMTNPALPRPNASVSQENAIIKTRFS